MSANEELGRFTRCYWKGSTYTDFPEECLEALQDCIRGRESREWMELDSVLGLPTVFRVDQIAMVYLSTPEARRKSYERDALWNRESEELSPKDWSEE